MRSGAAAIGMTIAKIPKPHRKPMVFRTRAAAGPEHHVVTSQGDEVKPIIKARERRAVVSAMKMVRLKDIPRYPTQKKT